MRPERLLAWAPFSGTTVIFKNPHDSRASVCPIRAALAIIVRVGYLALSEGSTAPSTTWIPGAPFNSPKAVVPFSCRPPKGKHARHQKPPFRRFSRLRRTGTEFPEFSIAGLPRQNNIAANVDVDNLILKMHYGIARSPSVLGVPFFRARQWASLDLGPKITSQRRIP